MLMIAVLILYGVAPSIAIARAAEARIAQSGNVSDFARFPRYDRVLQLEQAAVTSANVNIGDVNRDGHPDIVIAKGRHWPLASSLFLGDGQGRFSARDLFGKNAYRSYSASLADLDADGDLDIVLGNDEPDAKMVYLNDGKARFHAGSNYGLPEWPTRHVTTADVNRDGWPDIVVANRSASPGNFICLNRGRGRFDASCIPFSSEPATTITPADVNRDGWIDLVVPHRDGGQSYVYLASPNRMYASSDRVPFGPSNASIRIAEAADFDADGWLDIVAIDDERRAIEIYFGRKDGAFSPGVAIDNRGATPYALAVRDLNDDGKIDIVVGNVGAPATVFFNAGSGRRYTPVRFGTGDGAVYGIAIADLNDDGMLDIALARSNATNIVCFAQAPSGAGRDIP